MTVNQVGDLPMKLNAANARIRELEDEKETDAGVFRVRSMAQAFEAMELDPETGIGKAVAVLYEDEPEELAKFAVPTFRRFTEWITSQAKEFTFFHITHISAHMGDQSK